MGELLHKAIDLFLHLDVHLGHVISLQGHWTYGLLFLVIFLETGLVVTPFLPGDSLLFAAGVFSVAPEGGGEAPLNLFALIGLLGLAAILGDTANYWIGRELGPKVFQGESRLLNKKHLEKAHAFYEKHGGKTIILARFIPIIRTFAPFVAGIGKMTYGKFISYNIIGGLVWVAICVSAGHFFGTIPWVKGNFSLVALAIVFISVLPAAIEFLRNRTAKQEPERG